MGANAAEYAAMMRPILEDPFDMGARLIFADWLDDRTDEHPRAAFIRWQIREQPGRMHWVAPGMFFGIRGPDRDPWYFDCHNNTPFHIAYRGGFIEGVQCLASAFLRQDGAPDQSPLAWFRTFPITSVQLIGPMVHPLSFTSDMGYIVNLPLPIRAFLPTQHGIAFTTFDTGALAHRAARMACVNYGRARAGLPLLKEDCFDPA